MVSNFREVVALWGSFDEMASEIGHTREAVRKWSERNTIPSEWWLPILRSNKALSAGLSADLFTEFAARSPMAPAAAESEEARAS